MGAAPEADKALFVGNLDPRVTEELLFELFLQAGPVLKVKIPKDKDGKPKQFAFVNFKHEESVPYGMNLLNGIKLFGRPLKIQFRSGSSHGSQDGKSPVSLQNSMCTPSPSSTPSSIPNRFDRSIGGQSPTGFLTPQMQAPRSFSSPDSLQRQAMMNSHNIRQQQFNSMDSPMIQAHLDFPSPILSSQGQLPSNFHSGPLSSDQAQGQRKNRPRSHPYQQEGRQFSPEQRYGESNSDHMYRGGRDDYHDDRSADRAFRGSRDDYDRSFRGNRNDYLEEQSSDRPFRGNRDEFGDRSPSSWGRDYNPRRESPRDGRWCNRQ